MYDHLSIRNGAAVVAQHADTTTVSTTTTLKLLDNTAMAIPVAAMKTLLNVVQRSTSETMMGLQHELQRASQIIMNYNSHNSHQNNNNNNNTIMTPSSYSISLQSGIELFLHYITRSYLESPNFNDCRLQVLQRGQQFQQLSFTARDRIASFVAAHPDFIIMSGSNSGHTTTILTLGFSRVVAAILNEVSKTKHFDLIVVEGGGSGSSGPSSSHPHNHDDGTRTAQCYCQEMNIPVTVVPEAAMGYIMEERNVSMVLVGSYVIVENGGLFNKCGTYTLAMCAYTMNIPFYVAAESYKFARLYPLHQSDIPYNENNYTNTNTNTNIQTTNNDDHPDNHNNHAPPSPLQMRNPYVDYTPAKYITLFFTDLGILTTSAVSDELIRLYQ